MTKLNENRIIYEVISGSRAYGLSTPESDYDYRGIFIPSLNTFINPFAEHTMQFISKDPDRTIFNLYKYFELAANNNPNILELLFIDKEFIVKNTQAGEILRKNRNLFLSAKCRFTYLGYSFAQLKRIKTHKKYLLNPINNKPKRSDYGLDDNKSPMSRDEFGAFKSLIDNGGDFGKEIMVIFSRERKYRSDLQKYKQYQNWKKNRNPSRAKLEKKYGYDLKHATNLVRLIHQGKEILTKATLTVNIGNNKDILAVKNGDWSYNYLLKWTENFENEIAEIYDNNKYIVPKKPNRKEIEKIYFEILNCNLKGV